MTTQIFEKLKLFCITAALALAACGGGGSSPPPPAPVPVVVVPQVPDKRSVLTLQLMDARSQALGTGPLLDNPYDSFSFLLNGNPIVVTSRAIDDAKTFADLRSAIEGAINALKPTNPPLANLTVSLGSNYAVTDPSSGLPAVGQSILITDAGSGIITANPNGGWSLSSGFIPLDFMHRRIIDSNNTNP